MSTPTLLRVPAAAERLDASPATIYRLVAAGELDTVPIGTGNRPRIRIVADSIDAYIARHTMPGRKTGRQLGPSRRSGTGHACGG